MDHSTVAITIGLPRLHSRAKALERDNVGFKWVRNPGRILRLPICAVMFLYVACGLFMIVGFMVTPSSGTIPRWVASLVIFSILLSGLLYYFLFFHSWVSEEGRGHQEKFEGKWTFSLFSWAGVGLNVSKADYYDVDIKENARRFGSRRTITYEVSVWCRFWITLRLTVFLAFGENELALLFGRRDSRRHWA